MMHMESSTRDRSGILRELIRSPLVKDILRVNLNEMNPKTGSQMVKTLLGQDPEVFFGLISSLPVLINTLISASTELAIQLKVKYPPEMLKAFLTSLYDDIDKDALRQCGKAWTELATSLWKASPELRQAATGFLLSSGPEIKAGAINGLARFVNTVTQNNPQAFSTFIARTLSNIDAREVGKATHTLAGAFLDQKCHLTLWVWNLVRNRVKKRFGKM